MKVVISAAGTGGHINPAIAIANLIKKEEPGSEIVFIGTNRGLENDLVPRAGYQLKTIEAYGFQKEISIKNFKNAFKTFASKKKVINFFKEFKPDLVIRNRWIYLCTSIWCCNKNEYSYNFT
jgi:UDP-N-acetylglucosamine--N-acetylmuramyl-(pentapeptide) pyrophosphoryl-undecaprenol N-acetylglucosamine transferase